MLLTGEHVIRIVITCILVIFKATEQYVNTEQIHKTILSRDRAVGIATSYWLDDRGIGVRVPVGVKNFQFSMSFRRLWDPPNLSNGYCGLFPSG
jgi:hypothetical protein